ncbi:MAG TPA: FadR/GntR family transcriptional regulator [Bacillota bacterium]|nr:FadR/GntR family transcriptional regulator [Bacillota bacterium]
MDSLKSKNHKIDIMQMEKREPATEVVIKSIKRLLTTNEIDLGDRLPSEMELSQKLGVSRGSVREAMKILSAYGIVDIRRGDGTYIADTTDSILFDPLLFKLIVSSKNINEYRELREMIELGIIKLAIKNATEEDIASLENSYEFMRKETGKEDFSDETIIECELMFHTALGRATGNKLIQTIYNFVLDLYIPNIYKGKPIKIFAKEALISHRPIIDAIINKDIEAGEEAIKSSVYVWKNLNDNFEENFNV